MLRRWIGYYWDLRGIIRREKLGFKRKRMPESNIFKLQPKKDGDWFRILSIAADCLRNGGVIAVPTDTLYGLCTLAENADRLYKLKRRPDEKPLGLFVGNAQNISKFADQTVPNGLLTNLLPGPVTLLFNRSSAVPADFNPGVPSVGFRIPQARFVCDLCNYLPYYLIAQTSANISGTDKNPICIEDFKELWGELDMIIDGGPILENNGVRLGSTVVDLSLPGQYRVLRAGCAEIETINILREFGLETPEEMERKKLESTERRQLQIGEGREEGEIDNGVREKIAAAAK